jgi:hypothetical protein
MNMATAIRMAVEARRAWDEAIETYEHVRKSAPPEAASAALLIALLKARALGWAVEELERASAEVAS